MFEFYFQSGEFASDQGGLLKDFLLPFLGVAIPLLVYYFGERYDRSKERKKQEKFELDKLRYLDKLIKGALLFTEHFIGSCKKMVGEIENNPNRIGTFEMYAYDDLIRIVEKINQEEYYHSYVNIMNSEKISYIFNAMDTLSRVRESSEALWKDRLQNEKERKKKISALLDQSIDEINKLKIEHKNEITDFIDVLQIQIDSGMNLSEHKNDYMYLKNEYFEKIGLAINEKDLTERPYLSKLFSQMEEGQVECFLLINDNIAFAIRLSGFNKTMDTIFNNLRKESLPLSEKVKSIPLNSKS